jgi:hypothetical protein
MNKNTTSIALGITMILKIKCLKSGKTIDK